MTAVFTTCPDCNRLVLGDHRGSVVTPQPHACAGRCPLGHRLRPGDTPGVWVHVTRVNASAHYQEDR